MHPHSRHPRRTFLKKTAGTWLAATALSSTSLATAQNALIRTQGQQQGYKTLPVPLLTRDKTSVEVLEFFWFGCPHCYAFEPAINRWADNRPEYVSFVREAPPLNPAWEPHSRAFYAAEALGITDHFFDKMFNAIHQQKQPMRSPKAIAKLVASLDVGVTEDKFIAAMTSFTVEGSLKRSVQLATQAGISGVPSILINGKYVTGNTLAGGHQGIINVINTLTEQEHKTI